VRARVRACKAPHPISLRNGMKRAIVAEDAALAAVAASVSRALGRRTAGGRAEAWRARERGASGSTASESGRARPRDIACTARTATEPIRIPHGTAGARSLRSSRSGPFPPPPFLRSARPSASGRGGDGQTRPIERRAQHRHSCRPLRERALVAAWTVVGRSVARTGAPNPARGAERARLRAGEFPEAHAQRSSVRNRPVLVRRMVRRLARMAARLRPRAAVCRKCTVATPPRCGRRVGDARRRTSHLARACGVAALRPRAAHRFACVRWARGSASLRRRARAVPARRSRPRTPLSLAAPQPFRPARRDPGLNRSRSGWCTRASCRPRPGGTPGPRRGLEARGTLRDQSIRPRTFGS